MEKNMPIEFYLQDENIEAQYEIIGQFENLTFLKITKVFSS